MFSDRSFDVVTFTSELSSAKTEKCANIQTTEIVYSGNEVQTTETKNVETQTEFMPKNKPDVDYEKLAAFLKRVTPGIIEVLDETYGSNAFDDYDPQTSEESAANIEFIKKLSTTEHKNAQVKISDLAWGAGGGTLAVSHSIMYHEAWCDDLSKIQLYGFNREDKLVEKPSKTLEVNSCVMTLSYHPIEPSVIAAGLFNGDVLVWNLKDEDSITPTQICTHGDSVSQIYWKSRTIHDTSYLVSASTDGYIFIHKLVANFTTVLTYKRFKIAKEHNPIENARPRSSGGRRERAVEAGLSITTFDYSHKDPTLFIVGTLCGGIYKCNEERTNFVEGDEALLDPVIDEFERHEGSITCIKCSPSREVFVTSGTDKEIRVYDLNQHVSQQIISVDDTVVGLAWMMGNQDIFATYGAGATIKFYNVTSDKPLTNTKVETAGQTSISGLRVNSKRDLLAIGDIQGNVEIWKIPRQLF